MARFEWAPGWKHPRSRNHHIANSVKVQRALQAAAGAIYGRVAGGLAMHRDTGASKAFMWHEHDREYGHIDWFVGIDDTQGHQAAYNIFLIALGAPHKSGRKRSPRVRGGLFKQAGAAVRKVERRWNDDAEGGT